MNDWPCHVWLQKNSMPHHKGRLRGVLPTFMHKFGWWDIVYFITKPLYSRVFIGDGQRML